MQAKLRTQANDGQRHYEAGAVITTDSDWIRRLLVNGLAEAMDEETKALSVFPAVVERHKSPSLVMTAQETGVANAAIPALTVKTA